MAESVNKKRSQRSPSRPPWGRERIREKDTKHLKVLYADPLEQPESDLAGFYMRAVEGGK